MKRGILGDINPFTKVILLLMLVLLGGIISISIMQLVVAPIFGVDVTSLEAMTENISFMKWSQVFQSIGLFILPALLATFLFYTDSKGIMPGIATYPWQLYLFPVMIILLSQPFISWLGWFNQQLTLPESFSSIYNWASDKEKEMMELTQLFLTNEHWYDIHVNTFVIAVLPAVAEEWLFRGVLQRQLSDWFKSEHIAILMTAAVFSAIHVQFLTFLPRFALGIILGYLLYFTRNMWFPILAHFVNNFVALLVFSYTQPSASSTDAIESEIPKPNGILILMSLGVIYALMYLLKQRVDMQQTSS